MFERVIGSPVRDCCHALDTAEFRSKVKTLPLTLTPATVARLDHAAADVSSTAQRARRAAAVAAELRPVLRMRAALPHR